MYDDNDPCPLMPAVTRLLAERLYLEVPTPDTDLVDSGLLDSLMLVELLVQIEREFGVVVAGDDLELDDFRTVRSIAAYLERSREPADADPA